MCIRDRFSRSDKSEDPVLDTMIEEESGERGPLGMAILAGLLALTGAFLLVWYLSGNGNDAEVAAEDAAAAVPTEQVLVVTNDIPAGTSADEIAATPELYLSARAAPVDFIAQNAIRTTADLESLAGLTLTSDALCLLYTSPSPRDATLSRMPSSA